MIREPVNDGGASPRLRGLLRSLFCGDCEHDLQKQIAKVQFEARTSSNMITVWSKSSNTRRKVHACFGFHKSRCVYQRLLHLLKPPKSMPEPSQSVPEHSRASQSFQEAPQSLPGLSQSNLRAMSNYIQSHSDTLRQTHQV